MRSRHHFRRLAAGLSPQRTATARRFYVHIRGRRSYLGESLTSNSRLSSLGAAATSSVLSTSCNESSYRGGCQHSFNIYNRHMSSVSEVEGNTLLNKDQVEYLPNGITRQPDFFEEGITFIKDLDPAHIKSTNEHEKEILSANHSLKQQSVHDISEAISAFDNMCLTIISKGCANIHEGNDGNGPEVKAWHAAAIGWAELLTHSSEWSTQNGKNVTAAPMLTVAAVAPVLAQGGVHYLHRIDRLLADSSYADASESLVNMARYAATFRDVFVSNQDPSPESNVSSVPILSPRERWHLHALDQLLQNKHRQAMGAYLRLLELFPGDLLGLSLALDTAYTLGDADLALRASTNVATYWTERDAGRFGGNHANAGQTVATSLLAVGLASSSSSRTSTAERLAESALARDSDSAGGTAVWALAHSLAGEGRSQEMVSRLATADGVRLHERSGYLAFNTRMSGYGAISMLDTQRSAADRSAIRLYDGSFGHLFQYSGTDVEGAERGGEAVCMQELAVPTSVRENVQEAVGSMFSGWFGSGNDKVVTVQEPNQTTVQETTMPHKRSAEAVLTWLPPSPISMTHATALLLRLTLSGAISSSDERWANIKTAWASTINNDNNLMTPNTQTSIEFTPLALLAASILIEPSTLHTKPVSKKLEMAMEGLHRMGTLMRFGRLKIQAASSSNNNPQAEEWRQVVTYLARAVDSSRWEMPSGMSSATYESPANEYDSASRYPIGWDFDSRQFVEYALCHAAIQAGDYESLMLAKAVCSQGTTLRSNCPEMWNRYAVIMEQLGDDVAAENARGASVSMGGGEGSAAF